MLSTFSQRLVDYAQALVHQHGRPYVYRQGKFRKEAWIRDLLRQNPISDGSAILLSNLTQQSYSAILLSKKEARASRQVGRSARYSLWRKGVMVAMTAQNHTETEDYGLVQVLRLVALLLMAAGGLKLGGLWYAADRAIDPCFSTGLMAAIGFVEIIFGGAVLFGADRWPRPLSWAALLLFFVFLFTNIGVSGSGKCRDCGCLGPIAVTPRVMAVGDSLVIALLLLGTLRGPLLVSTAWAVLPVVICAVWAWFDYRWETANERLFARIDVRQWVGLPFPLIEALDGGQESRQGKWVVLLYDGRCGRCQNELKLFEQRSVPIAECKRAVVLLSESGSSLPSQAAIWRIKQTARPAVEVAEPPFQLPAYLLLSDGRVLGAAREWRGLQWDVLKTPPTDRPTSKGG